MTGGWNEHRVCAHSPALLFFRDAWASHTTERAQDSAPSRTPAEGCFYPTVSPDRKQKAVTLGGREVVQMAECSPRKREDLSLVTEHSCGEAGCGVHVRHSGSGTVEAQAPGAHGQWVWLNGRVPGLVRLEAETGAGP